MILWEKKCDYNELRQLIYENCIYASELFFRVQALLLLNNDDEYVDLMIADPSPTVRVLAAYKKAVKNNKGSFRDYLLENDPIFYQYHNPIASGPTFWGLYVDNNASEMSISLPYLLSSYYFSKRGFSFYEDDYGSYADSQKVYLKGRMRNNARKLQKEYNELLIKDYISCT